MNDFVNAQQRILVEIVNNPRVQTSVSNALQTIANDPHVQQLLTEIFTEVFVDNPRLKEIFDRNWSSPEAQYALEFTNRRLEPTITAIGETMFGNPFKSITPEFARVMRNRVLKKDDRWLILQLGDSPDSADLPAEPDSMVVLPGDTSTENPFHIPSRPRH
jgi:hypothetical protein